MLHALSRSVKGHTVIITADVLRPFISDFVTLLKSEHKGHQVIIAAVMMYVRVLHFIPKLTIPDF